MNWSVIAMSFAVPFAIVSGVSLPILIGTWIERKLPPADKGEQG